MDRLLTVAEVSDLLRIPVTTLYQWRHRGEGPRGFRVGRHVRYDESEVRGWLQGQADRETQAVAS